MEAMFRRLQSEDSAGTFIKHFLISIELLVGDGGKFGSFGQVVAVAVILAFAGDALPSAVRVTEENFKAEVGAEGLVPGHFLAKIVS